MFKNIERVIGLYFTFLCMFCLVLVTTLFLEEDKHSYGKLMLKYYVAEGVINKHEIFLASAECKPESFLQVCLTNVHYCSF